MHVFESFKSLESKLVLLTTILVSTIGFFSATSIAIAIPNIQASLGATIDQIQWVLYSFMIVVSVGILISGTLADYFGFKKVLLWGIGIFSIGTILGIVSPNVYILILSRAIQGIGSALMVPQSLGIINTFYDKEIRGKSIGIWTASSGLVTLFGPVLAGFLVDVGSWRWVFASVIPIIFFSLFLVVKFIPLTKSNKKFYFDGIGILLLLVGLTAISYGLIQGQSDFKLINGLTVLTGLVLLIFFGIYESKISQPLFDFKVFLIRSVWLANLFCLLMYIPLTAISILMPVYFQQLIGMSALESSLYLIPLVVGIIIFSVISGSLADKLGNKVMILTGTFICFVGYVCLASIGNSYDLISLPSLGMFLVGSGFGVFIPAITKLALDVNPSVTGLASGINNSITRFAGVVAVVVFGGLVTFVFNSKLANQLQSFNPEIYKTVWEQREAVLEINIPSSVTETESSQINQVISESFVSGLKTMFIFSIVLTVISGGVVANFLNSNHE